ncbi:MAG: hypothetical protein EU544_01070 [Promethearchaeota archaeon]|nr:MAG: hypothetical protein EU544_01070 [Candidatus Lokiarchaeota archaeon]
MALKGILWGIIFIISALIYIIIPGYLIAIYWDALANLVIDGKPVYTYALFFLFLYIITIIISLIYIAATCRAFIQRNSEDMGIPRAVKGFGLISDIIIITLFIVWYILFQEIAFFVLTPP